MRHFDDLVDEAATVPIDAWDFSWLEGRAVEERPSWHYFDRVVERAAGVSRMLDLDTGVGNLVADLPELPPLTVATEAYPPSIAAARPRLRRRGAHLVGAPSGGSLPFTASTFDLITSRHPIETSWPEIGRVLAAGGSYLSQQVGPSSLHELRERLMGPRPSSSRRDPTLAQLAAEDAGLVVEGLQVESPLTTFLDIGAVVYFLRLVVWTVPDFTVDGYRDRLRSLHQDIERNGSFEARASRFLIDARRPG